MGNEATTEQLVTPEDELSADLDGKDNLTPQPPMNHCIASFFLSEHVQSRHIDINSTLSTYLRG